MWANGDGCLNIGQPVRVGPYRLLGVVTDAKGLKVRVEFDDPNIAPEWLDAENPVVAREFAAWSELVGAKDYPVVAHNAHFDHAFVEQWRFNNWRVFAVPPLSPVWICTLTLSQALHPDEKKHGLDEVCKRFGLAERPGAHDALTDALLAGAVYHRLTTDAQVTA